MIRFHLIKIFIYTNCLYNYLREMGILRVKVRPKTGIRTILRQNFILEPEILGNRNINFN